MVSLNELGKILPLIVGGILFCFFAVWVIKQASQIIKSRNYKLIYWRYMIPMLLSCIIPAGVLEIMQDEEKSFSLSQQKMVFIIPVAVVCAICCVLCLVKFGFRQGISIFLIQSMCALILICFLYAAVVIFVLVIALMLGAEMTWGNRYVQAVAVDCSEIVFVTPSGSNMWIDQEGNIYYYDIGSYIRRQNDMKRFEFM